MVIKKVLLVYPTCGIDQYPDLSYLGQFTSRKDVEAMDRRTELDDPPGRGEHLYWMPGKDPEEVAKWYEKNENKSPAEAAQIALLQAREDYELHKRFSSGELCMYGLGFKAIVGVSDDGKQWLTQELSSGGLWGIESNSGEDYFLEVLAGQWAELVDVLHEFGFTDEQIAAAEFGKPSGDAKDAIDATYWQQIVEDWMREHGRSKDAGAREMLEAIRSWGRN
jgi:hypothetical protein